MRRVLVSDPTRKRIRWVNRNDYLLRMGVLRVTEGRTGGSEGENVRVEKAEVKNQGEKEKK